MIRSSVSRCSGSTKRRGPFHRLSEDKIILNAAHRGIQSIGSIVAWRSPRAAPTVVIHPHDTGADQILEVRGADGGEPASA